MGKTRDYDHRVIDAVSVGLGGQCGQDDDKARLLELIEKGNETVEPDIGVACDIAVAFMRWAQDLKSERNQLREKNRNLRERVSLARND